MKGINMKEELRVKGMSCNHCVQSITEALKNLKNIKKVNIDLEKEIVEIEYRKNINLDEVKEIIEDLGFDVI